MKAFRHTYGTALAAVLVTLATLCLSVSAEPISYSGRVQTTAGSALSGARVWVPGTVLYTYTNTAGQFSLQGDFQGAMSVREAAGAQQIPGIHWANGVLRIENPEKLSCVVEVYSVNGRLVTRYASNREALVVISLTEKRIAAGILIIRIAMEKREFVYRYITGRDGRAQGATIAPEFKGLARALASYEIAATSAGYLPGSFPQTGPSASNLVLSLSQQTSDSLNRFQPYYEGLGVVTNLSTGQTVQLPMEKRIHVIVFPEGYMAADFVARKYETDLATWFSEVFRVVPMSYFREAFVIWKYPVVSNQHIVPDGSSDTYFKVGVAGGSISSSLDTCRSRMWQVISAEFPYRTALQYYPANGNTSRNAKNMTVSFMVYDPQYGRSGYSGITTTLANPADANQRMATAFSRGHQHEFLHALAKVGDEYYDAAHTPLSSTTVRQESAYLTNVVCSAKCDSLPWQHLLYGGQNNPGVDSLVGAFGTNGRFHPEFKCLMNGSHDNAVLYGGSSNLRTDDRLCNWCREITSFRIYERCMVLDNTTTSWNTWVSSYRAPFYQTITFNTPGVVPQTNSVGTPWFLPCEQ
jgi:hypothetical protein